MCDKLKCGTAAMFCEPGFSCPLGGDAADYISTSIAREAKQEGMLKATLSPDAKNHFPTIYKGEIIKEKREID